MAKRGSAKSSSRPALSRRIHTLSFELRRLTESSGELLSVARVGADGEVRPAELFRERLTWPLEDVAVIEKCNAVILVATASVDADPDFVRELLLDRWLEVSPGLERIISRIDHHSGVAALEYLGEVAVGLRSVVLGDGQVYSQVVHGLRTAQSFDGQRSPFSLISRRLAGLRTTVRSSTSLQEGNVSLERIAAERLVANLGLGGSTVAVAGLGRTGQLIGAILSKETSHELVATNRTPRPSERTSDRIVMVPWGELSMYKSADAVVLCLSDTTETRRYAERIFGSLDERASPLVIDMSFPSITRQLDPTPARVLHLDQLAEEANRSLESRRRGINKAKQAVTEWTEAVQHDLADSITRLSPVSSRGAPGSRSTVSPARRKAQMLTAIRNLMAGDGFHETQTDTMSSSGRRGRTLRRSIRTDAVLAADPSIDRAYEIGPVWLPDSSWAPSEIDQLYVLAAANRSPTDLQQVADLATGVVQRAARALRPAGSAGDVGAAIDARRLEYAAAMGLMPHHGFSSVAYGARLDFHVLRSIADVVRFETGERLVVLTDCPEPIDRFDIARDPKTGLARSFRILLDGWQVASGSLVEIDGEARRRRMVSSGRPVGSLLDLVDEALPMGIFEVALDHLVKRCEERPRSGP